MGDTESGLMAFLKAAEEFADAYEERTQIRPTSVEIQSACCDALGLANSVDLSAKTWSAPQLSQLLSDYTFSGPKPPPLERIQLKRSILPNDLPRLLTEETVKALSEIWTIHKSDVDPFPSDPHAHCEGTTAKLHLGTGVFYRKHEVVSSLRWKDLKTLRARIKYRPLPSLDKQGRKLALSG